MMLRDYTIHRYDHVAREQIAECPEMRPIDVLFRARELAREHETEVAVLDENGDRCWVVSPRMSDEGVYNEAVSEYGAVSELAARVDGLRVARSELFHAFERLRRDPDGSDLAASVAETIITLDARFALAVGGAPRRQVAPTSADDQPF